MGALLGGTTEGGGAGGPAGILFPVVHLLLELFGLLLVDKGEASETVFGFKGVKVGSVLVVDPGVEDLLVPNDTAAGRRDIDQLQPVRVADEVIGQHNGTLEACVVPSRPVGVGDVEAGDGDGLDLVGLLGDMAFDRVLVVVVEDGRHVGWVGPIRRNSIAAIRGIDRSDSRGRGRDWVGFDGGPLRGGGRRPRLSSWEVLWARVVVVCGLRRTYAREERRRSGTALACVGDFRWWVAAACFSSHAAAVQCLRFPWSKVPYLRYGVGGWVLKR